MKMSHLDMKINEIGKGRKNERMFPQRNRNFKAFHPNKIGKNRQNRNNDKKTPSVTFSSFITGI